MQPLPFYDSAILKKEWVVYPWVYARVLVFGPLCVNSHLRYDTLAQMLTLGNIHAGGKVLVFETCAGLVLGAVMERMGGTETSSLCYNVAYLKALFSRAWLG